MNEACDLPATEARALIGAKKLSPVELTESCIARIEAVDHAVNAMVARDFERALDAARDAEAAARAHLEQLERDLQQLTTAGTAEPSALEVALTWAGSEDLAGTEAIVADDAFGHFGPEGIAAVLQALAERGCQAIYLTEDPAVLSWAIGLPREIGAATAATTPRPRRFALVGS
jgi:hypothetical protein